MNILHAVRRRQAEGRLSHPVHPQCGAAVQAVPVPFVRPLWPPTCSAGARHPSEQPRLVGPFDLVLPCRGLPRRFAGRPPDRQEQWQVKVTAADAVGSRAPWPALIFPCGLRARVRVSVRTWRHMYTHGDTRKYVCTHTHGPLGSFPPPAACGG